MALNTVVIYIPLHSVTCRHLGFWDSSSSSDRFESFLGQHQLCKHYLTRRSSRCNIVDMVSFFLTCNIPPKCYCCCNMWIFVLLGVIDHTRVMLHLHTIWKCTGLSELSLALSALTNVEYIWIDCTQHLTSSEVARIYKESWRSIAGFCMCQQ